MNLALFFWFLIAIGLFQVYGQNQILDGSGYPTDDEDSFFEGSSPIGDMKKVSTHNSGTSLNVTTTTSLSTNTKNLVTTSAAITETEITTGFDLEKVNINNNKNRKTSKEQDIDEILTEEVETEIDNLNEIKKIDKNVIESKTINNVDHEQEIEEKSKFENNADGNVKKTAEPEETADPANSMFENSQFLAAVIVAACVGLLFAVCVIALIAYRMKKKDEGSYSLDYQKKASSKKYQYTQGQEYFA